MAYFSTGTRLHRPFLNALEAAYREGCEKLEPVFSGDAIKFSTLGKLGAKDEPAGKVRIFAMVDCWTQWLLYPLHCQIQDILRTIDEDATFDQVGKMEKKLRELEDMGIAKAFSYDLSAATDRLPIWLQVLVLRPLLGTLQADNWARLLTDRYYTVPRKYWRSMVKFRHTSGGSYDVRNQASFTGKFISFPILKYATGQPMGALSS